MMERIYNKSLIIAAFVTLLISNVHAQDIRYSQPFTNPLTLNPALMSINNDLRLDLNYRNQWTGASAGGYTTSSLTALYPIFLGNGGNKLDIGINTIMDKSGAFNNLYISAAIGYSLRIAETHILSLAINGGYSQKSLDINNLTFDDQYVHGSYNSSNATDETVLYDKINYADVGFGLLWSSDYSRSDSKLNGYVGISGHHLNMPKESFTGESGVLLKRYTYLGGIKIFGDNRIDFTPNIILSSQGGAYEAAVGLYLDFNFSDEGKLTVGCWYRNNDDIALLIKIDYKFFAVGYSYDIPNSALGRAISGLNTHEVSLSFKVGKKEGAPDSLVR